MCGKIIVVSGYLASGKSMFAVRLAKALNIPCLVKDTFKSALCASVQITNREISSHYSAVTFDAMMYVAERLLETGTPFVIEGNFVPGGVKKTDEAKVIKTLIERHDYQALIYKFTGDTAILHKRFIERERRPERGQANRMFLEPSLGDFTVWCKNLDGFDVGGTVVEIDTTEFGAVDFEYYMENARVFVEHDVGRGPCPL